MKYTINGKFLTQRVTGVQRYAKEIVTELDKINETLDIQLLVPKNKNITFLNLKNISIIRYGIFKGSLWEQISYPIYLFFHKRTGINFCASPVIKPDYAYMHDIIYLRHPTFCNKIYLIYNKILFYLTIIRAKKIFTVSDYSKSDIMDYYHLRENKNKPSIVVIPNGWEHMERVNEDDTIFQRYPILKQGEYIFSLGSLAPVKNFQWIFENAKKNPNLQYVISGSINKMVHGNNNSNFSQLSNVHYLGYLSDEEAKALMIHAKAFLYPSIVEGFGIPPLEALGCGAKIIISDISVFHEIYGDSAYYVDPYNPDIDLSMLLEKNVSTSEKPLENYTWKKSAKKLYDELK